MNKIKRVFFTCLMIMGFTIPAFADNVADNVTDKLSDMEKQIESITNELTELKMQQPVEAEAATKLHGYGELHYSASDSTDEIDLHRMVIGISHSFTDRIVLDVEVDFEHAAQDMDLEFAQLDFLISEAFNLRAGAMLMPVGYMNEYHEPPLFYSVERPYVQKYLIPTTWKEGGIGIFGEPAPGFRYRAYIVGGLDASKFRAKDGIRKGRQQISEAKAEDLAFVGRLEYVGMPGLQLGTSFYRGGAAQGNSNLGNATVTLAEADIRYRLGNLEFTGLYTQTSIDDTNKIYEATKVFEDTGSLKTDGEVVGKKQVGWYVELAYHIPFFLKEAEHEIVGFARYEAINTQESLAAGLTGNPANDRDVKTIGLAYYPVPDVALKTNLDIWNDGTGDNWNVFNLGATYMF